VGDMDVHRDLQFRAFAPHGFEPGIVRVQALLTRQGAPLHARTFIGKLSDAAGALSITPFQLARGALGPLRRSHISPLEGAPELDPAAVRLEELALPVEFDTRGSGEDHSRLDADLIHGSRPCRDVLSRADVALSGMGVNIDYRHPRLLQVGL